MKTYTITKVSGSPDWSAIPALEMNESYYKTLEEIPVRAWTQIAYNDEALLIRQWTREPNIRRELTGMLDEVCEDSCLEVFLCPIEGDERYINVEYNPNRSRYLGFGTGIPDLVRLVPEDNNDAFDPKVTMTEDGWELTYRIPYAFIRRFFPDFAPEAGKAMRVNCSKCGNLTEIPHWLTWNRLPCTPTSFTFHLPSKFGRMIFG
ncbi:MAG: carbohydrate-binding family 9-like protein [Oscillospiraceae bacterium]|nr:carbohydrate-binding family 9-like protein [Oscillospiraceae bacterium]